MNQKISLKYSYEANLNQHFKLIGANVTPKIQVIAIRGHFLEGKIAFH